MDRKFSFKKSLKNDFPLFSCFLLMFVPVAVTLYFIFVLKLIDFNNLAKGSILEIIKTSDFLVLAGMVLLFLAAVSCFIRGIAYIKSFENEEESILGKVVDIRYVKDRCGVDVEFELFGTAYKKHFVLMNNSQTKYIHMDSEINLLVKNQNPKKVLIEELYFDK